MRVAAPALLYLRPRRSEAERSQAWIDRQLGKVHDGLAAMAKGLADNAFCCGIHLSLADIAVGCALGYLDFRFPNIAWRNEPLGADLSRLIGLPVVVENDGNVAAWGEFRYGAGRDHDDQLMVTVGTGIGGDCGREATRISRSQGGDREAR